MGGTTHSLEMTSLKRPKTCNSRTANDSPFTKHTLAGGGSPEKCHRCGISCCLETRKPVEELQSSAQPRTQTPQGTEAQSQGACPHPLRPGSGSSPASRLGTASSGTGPAAPAPPP